MSEWKLVKPKEEEVSQSNTGWRLVKPETVDTIIGKLPRHMPEYDLGTPENQKMVNEMIDGFAGTPGIQEIGKVGGSALNLLKRFIQKATQRTQPFEEAATKAAGEFNVAERAAQVPKTGAMIENAATPLENLENEIGKHINIEGSHDVNIASAIKNRVKSVEDYWSDAYKKFEENIRDKQFHMPEQVMENLSYDTDAIMQRVKAGANPKTVVKEMEAEAAANQNPFYKQLTSKAPTSKDTNAADFLAKYRDFRDSLGGLKADLKSERYGSIEKEKIKDAIAKGKEMESQIKETLNKGLGEFKPEFDRINEGYAKQVFPLRKNPIVKAAKEGKLSSNVMHDLRTNQSGMPLLRDMVKQDPEILRNIIGQRYKLKPSELFAPNARMREYLDEMPEFKKLLQNKEKLLKDTAERKDITLKQKLDAEAKLKEITEARSALRSKIGYAAGGAAGAYFGIPGIRSLGKFLTGDND